MHPLRIVTGQGLSEYSHHIMFSRRRYFLYLIGLGLLVLLIWHYDPRLIFQKMSTMSPPWVLLAGACILGSGLLGAVNVFLFVGRDRKLALADFLPLYWVSWAVGLIAPGQVGDLASIGFLLRRHSLSLAKVLGRAVLDKAISLFVMLGFAIAGLVIFVHDLTATLDWLLWFAMFISLGGTVVYLTRARWEEIFDASKPGPIGALARMMTELVQTMRQAPTRVLFNVGLTVTKLIVTGTAYWAMFYALGETDLPMLRVIVLATMAGLIAYLPISINGLGTVEAAGLFLFGQVGIGATTVISAYIGLRVLVLGIACGPALGWWVLSVRRTDSLT